MPRGRGRPKKNTPTVEEPEEEYEVERVESHQIAGKGKRAKLQYLVKWKNYPPSDNTWEPSEAVENAHDLVDEYWATRGGEQQREEVLKQLKASHKYTTTAPVAATSKEKDASTASTKQEETENKSTEPKKRKTISKPAAAAPASPPAKKQRASNSAKEASETKEVKTTNKPTETLYESEDEFDVSDSEVENENFRINKPWNNVYKVQYVRRDEEDNELYAIVRWKDAKLAKYKTSTVAKKAPLKLIEFYENRLSFQED